LLPVWLDHAIVPRHPRGEPLQVSSPAAQWRLEGWIVIHLTTLGGNHLGFVAAFDLALCAQGDILIELISFHCYRPATSPLKVVKDTRNDALRAAKDFLDQGFPFVTIISDGHVYTVEEFVDFAQC
jgi:hypothetical protein